MEIPIVGYDSEIPPELGGIIRGILKEEGLSLEDFRVMQFQEFDLRGGLRDLVVVPEGLEIGPMEDDDLNPGRKKCLLKFSLQKGSYATMAVRAIFS
jgi:tRNA(Glu) U13 pseudouridine synthase TruD